MAGHMGMDWNTQKGLKVRTLGGGVDFMYIFILRYIPVELGQSFFVRLAFILSWSLHGALIIVFIIVWALDPHYISIQRHLIYIILY